MSLTKRQRKENPRSIADNESLACVASPFGPIVTSVASPLIKEIVLERLTKEIVEPFHLNLSIPRQRKSKQLYVGRGGLTETDDGSSPTALKRQRVEPTANDHSIANLKDDSRNRRSILRSRLFIGTNQCTRALEQARTNVMDGGRPCLILLARDVYPPTILSHVPHLAKRVDCPLLLLPGRASTDLGKALGVKKTAIVLFLSRASDDADVDDDDSNEHEHNLVDSFVDFIVSKIEVFDQKKLPGSS